jgi:hypothetical protein
VTCIEVNRCEKYKNYPKWAMSILTDVCKYAYKLTNII